MNQRTPKTRDRPTGIAPRKPAQIDLTSPAPDASPKLPHERDERVGSTDGVPDANVQQAARDVARGIQDTSRAPEADAAYKKLKKA